MNTARISLALLAALLAIVLRSKDYRGSTLAGALVIDGPALLLQGILVVLGLIGIIVMSERFAGRVACAVAWCSAER